MLEIMIEMLHMDVLEMLLYDQNLNILYQLVKMLMILILTISFIKIDLLFLMYE